MTNERVVISRVPVRRDRDGFLVYDLEKRRLIAEISDYAHTLLEERGNSLFTVEQGLQHVVEFWRYLLDQRIHLGMVTDRVMRAFRDENYKKVRSARSHRGSDSHAKSTVNIKLSRIYDWLIWLQDIRRLPLGTVGHRGLVTALREAPASRWVRGVKRSSVSARKYPLLYRVPNENAKHRSAAAVVTDEHVNGLFALFLSRHEPFVAQRNILFADVAESAGLRRGSICSLKVDQFDLAAIERAQGEFLVRPARQKFGYANTFGIELTLAYRIRQFIDDYWIPWVEERGIRAGVHLRSLFISAKTGKPITERAMTQTVSRGFRELGLAKGIGPHSLRSKFASEESDAELAERRELGLDTSNMSIAASLAMKLGHHDPSQFYRYASSSQAREARIAREGKRAQVKALQEENETLKARLRNFDPTAEG